MTANNAKRSKAAVSKAERIRKHNLVKLAERTLLVLERDAEWGPDTVDAIASAAIQLRLAVASSDGMFTRTVA